MLRDQSERSKWSREKAQNLILHFFSHNYHNYSMFRDVPCSGFYRRPYSWTEKKRNPSAVFLDQASEFNIRIIENGTR